MLLIFHLLLKFACVRGVEDENENKSLWECYNCVRGSLHCKKWQPTHIRKLLGKSRRYPANPGVRSKARRQKTGTGNCRAIRESGDWPAVSVGVQGPHWLPQNSSPGHPPGLHNPTVWHPKLTDPVSSCCSSKSWGEKLMWLVQLRLPVHSSSHQPWLMGRPCGFQKRSLWKKKKGRFSKKECGVGRNA